PECSCVFLLAQIARETAGAASNRSSLRPLYFEEGKRKCKPRAIGVARRRNCIHSSLRAQRSNPSIPAPRRGLLRCARNDGERAVLLEFVAQMSEATSGDHSNTAPDIASLIWATGFALNDGRSTPPRPAPARRRR